MKAHPTRLTILVACAAVVFGTPAHAQGFEGAITVKMGPAGGQEATYLIKGQKLRMNMTPGSGSMGQMSIIVDGPAKRSYMLMNSQQMYMERDMANMARMQRGGHGSPDIAWTGRKETVAGVECEHATITAGDGTQVDACIAKGFGYFAGGGGPGMRGSGWQQSVEGGFPLKVQRVGSDQPIFEVTRIEKRPVSDDEFTPPSGWHKMDMPNMLGRP